MTINFLNSLPLDDQAAFDVLNNGHFCGIFQFAGNALKHICKQMKITSLEDMMVITSLARPGPDSEKWIRRKTGREPVAYPHELFEPILKDTLGIIIFQEQVMRICRDIGDLSWEDVNAIRRGMGKTLGKEYLDKFGDQWKRNAEAKGIDSQVCNQVWIDLCVFGKYAFNKSHAVAYSIVSYWCCWLKAHHPLEFAAATLDAESDPQKQIALLRELKSEGIDYVAVDPEHSTDRWTPVTLKNGKKRLVGPLTAIKGIGPATVMELLDCRASGNPIRETLRKRLEAATTEIDTLYPVTDRVKQLHPDLAAINIVSTPTPILKVQCGLSGEVMIIGVAKKIAPKDENEAVNIAKREAAGRRGRLSGPTQALNLFIQDDSDEIFAKIDRFRFEQLGRAVVDRGRAGKAIYCLKGSVPNSFRMVSVNAIRFLGFMDD